MNPLARFLVPFIAFAGASLSTGVASATYDHVCWMRLTPGSGSLGTAGYIQVTVYTQPNCAGSYVGSYSLCSGGATSSACASSTTFRYSEALLAAQYQALRAAQAADQPVTISSTTCIGGTAGCAGSVYTEYVP
jgi:hypothetical protein